ncbi:cation-translocating P-type ATPase [Hymenobacter jeollabukensis]|uniref:Cation-translocating P-type ATPase n=1 Tax=Hymenobacter jeollabukensis TaxID=2025313 RepID=A0A5R8WVG9_9BACT|nr:cation-translocating P-type ATPase [Hymenobacter jeollabukensis]TLM96469.1 cation-translocating P-type ATPase [Hymenobacter jeollabukensis]
MVSSSAAPLPAGLAPAEVTARRRQFGRNTLVRADRGSRWLLVRRLLTEPMFVLLLLTAGLYLLMGSRAEALTVLSATVLVVGISLYQEVRSDKALQALQTLTQPRARVRRAGEWAEVAADEVVVGDVLTVTEGEQVVADGTLLEAHDLLLDESFLTGESLPVAKAAGGGEALYAGSAVVRGGAVVEVTAVGEHTRLGRIGGLIRQVEAPPTPLQRQVAGFVRRMALVGGLAFVLVWAYHWWDSGSLSHGLLHGLTLAMAILPEEIPAALAAFMALGAWRLMRRGLLVKQPQTVETLGSATIICVDKTGTLTQNQMALTQLYCPGDAGPQPLAEVPAPAQRELLSYAMWASEPQPFDPMEQALHRAYAAAAEVDLRPAFQLVHEYPLGGQPPLMTRVFAGAAGQRVVAAKGAPEGILARCALAPVDLVAAQAALQAMAAAGLRVLGVARSQCPPADYPATQEGFAWEFVGLVGFSDPPKASTAAVLRAFYGAGIEVKMITGDNALTALSIARQVGMRRPEPLLTGSEVLALDEATLRRRVREVNLYARMVPEAKLRVIEALKADGEVVAMTGDGVNDAPALKAAHIGVAMGRRGTELARQAAALVLLDAELTGMVTAVELGRRIYQNLQKAVLYIVAIHVPLVLAVLVPSLLAGRFPVLLGPVHVIFLELLMGPTCSIVFENEPTEAGTLQEPPRPLNQPFLAWAQLGEGVGQGLVVAVGVLGLAYYALHAGLGEGLARTLLFVTLVLANVLLTLVSRSRRHSLRSTWRYANALLPVALGLGLLLLAACLLWPTGRQLFQLVPLNGPQLALCAAVAVGTTVWFEAYKLWRNVRCRARQLALAPAHSA